MNIAKQIRELINKIPVGVSFGYDDLKINKEDYLTAAKALERMQQKGEIKKISKGKFYKPEQTVFGELSPDYNEQLKPYLFENGKRIAYVTGISLYNQMGLTTQVPYRIAIASQKKRIYINRGALLADAVKSYVEVTDTNYKLLGILDALKDIKKIPDSNVKNAVIRLSAFINDLNNNKRKELIKYALSYPPRVRALLGSILDNINDKNDLSILKKELNPLTTYKIGLTEKDLPTIKSWNIA
jgi:hypothetical protein